MSKRTLIVFIAMTGNPSKEKLIDMMAGYKKVGINDVMVYPRTGLEVEYMSDAWREILQNCIDYAKENDMRVWLYDELNWPSGTCNHKVFYKNDAHYSKRFRVENGKVKVLQSGYCWDHSTYPFSDCKNDLSPLLRDKSKYFLRELDAETGEVLNTIYGTDISDDLRGGGADLLNIDAVKSFIETTHQKYYEWFGEYFGNIIPGVFTDEPHISFGPSKEGYMQYPYYTGICEDYRKEFGTELIEDMLLHEARQPDNNFLKNYNITLTKQFQKGFMGTIHDWCDEHGLEFTGHFFQDDSATDSVRSTGDIFAGMDKFHIPGVDEIYTALSYEDDFLALPASCGSTIDFLYSQLQNMRRNGKKGTMVELFALGPYNMSFAQRSRAVWFAAAHGLTHYFVAMGHFDAKGNYLRNQYFMNSSYALFDHEGMADVAKAAELAIPYADKIPTYTVSIRYPFNVSMDNIGKTGTIDYDFLMKDCIEILGKNQIQWKLLREDEASDTNITISFGPNGILEENTGEYYKTAADLFAVVGNKLTREITVTEKSGVLARDVFVRTYTDGSFIVINRSDKNGSERDLVLHKDGKKTVFHLYDFGVYCGEEQPVLCRCDELLADNVRVDLNGTKRFKRCEFFKGHSFEFECDEDIEAVLHICAYPEKRDVYLDGEKIEYNLPETDFTDCFNPLYLKSEPILFEKTPNYKSGTHIITIPETDRAFLPMVILEGDIKWVEEFDPTDNKVHNKLLKCSDYINPEVETPFYKNASLHFDVTLPEGKGAVATLQDYHGLVEFKVEGETVAKRGTAPYHFEISKEFGGKTVHCEVKYYGTFKALFGDVAKIEAEGVDFRDFWVKNITPVSAKDETVSYNGLQIFVKD